MYPKILGAIPSIYSRDPGILYAGILRPMPGYCCPLPQNTTSLRPGRQLDPVLTV